MALAAPTTAATIAATLWIVRSASSSKQAQSWAPAGVDSTVSVIDCAMGLVDRQRGCVWKPGTDEAQFRTESERFQHLTKTGLTRGAIERTRHTSSMACQV
jgi:hypothetical protein